jgi:Immunoglobulin-like domain of bacterial spore germination
MGSQPCPATVASASNWDAIIPTQPPSTKVERVACGNLMGVSSLQAMVTVRTSGVEALLDVYVYNHLTDPHPNKVFALMGLYKGDAKISNYNSLLTAEVDQNSSVNKGKSDAEFVQDLSREFKWSDNAATLVPTAFPGIFPDITRYQAEGDQQAVNQGDAHWKLDASIVASNFATTLLKWPSDSPATIVSGGGQNDKNAVVSVKNPRPAGGTIKLTMDRLELNTNGGIWIVTNAVSDGTAITEPDPNKLGQISSPVSVKGKGNAFEAVIGKVLVLDHNYNPIGTADARTPPGAEGNGNLSFSTSVTYTSTFKNGLQDGLVVLYTYSNADGSIAGIAMSKVLLT